MFQKVMDTLLQGIPGVACFIDDIIVTGATEEEHLKSLERVMKVLQDHGVRLKLSKCRFMQDQVEYLGLIIDKHGLHASPEKVRAVLEAPKPRNIKELRAFLGMMNYYRKFIPNLATMLKPLTNLLQKNCRWLWRAAQARAFKEAKQVLTSMPVLTHYNQASPVRLATDASAYGVGAVLSHVGPEGEEKPIAFASRTLTATEARYAQIEKEALGIVFGVQKFLYGRRFTLITDHKPLTTIFGPKKGVPALAAARFQRWAIQLSAYVYDIEYCSTAQHGNADGLSRLPVQGSYSTTSSKTIQVLRQLFAAYGLPQQLVTDNGPQFTSDEFSTFLKRNGIKHSRCTPYHPASNGEAERFVRTFKESMKAGSQGSISLAHRVQSFLLTYRSTPHATTGRAPCELF